jgi:hypothetical protein
MKLREDYTNERTVTQNGLGFFKDKYTLADDSDFEIKQLLKDRTLIKEKQIIEESSKVKTEIFMKNKVEKPQVIFEEKLEIIEDNNINTIIDKAPEGVKEIVTKNNKKKFSETDKTISD